MITSKRKQKVSQVIVYVLICFSIMPSLACAAKVLPPIEYAYPEQSVWSSKSAVGGGFRNPLLNVADRIFSELGVTWSAKPFPANRLFNRLEHGKSHFSILVKASRLAGNCIFSKSPITYAELRVYRKVSAPPITTMAELNGKKVIIIRGYSYGKLRRYIEQKENNVVSTEANRHVEAFKMFARGRGDYLIDYAGPSEEILGAYPIPEITYSVFARVKVYLVLSKDYPDAEGVMSKLEDIAKTIDITQWGLDQP